MASTPPGTRICWSDLPGAVRAAAERIIDGGTVTEFRSQAGGFSPGTADRVLTSSGRRASVKAVNAGVNADSARLARQELHVTGALPAHAPVPRLLGGFDTASGCCSCWKTSPACTRRPPGWTTR